MSSQRRSFPTRASDPQLDDDDYPTDTFEAVTDQPPEGDQTRRVPRRRPPGAPPFAESARPDPIDDGPPTQVFGAIPGAPAAGEAPSDASTGLFGPRPARDEDDTAVIARITDDGPPPPRGGAGARDDRPQHEAHTEVFAAYRGDEPSTGSRGPDAGLPGQSAVAADLHARTNRLSRPASADEGSPELATPSPEVAEAPAAADQEDTAAADQEDAGAETQDDNVAVSRRAARRAARGARKAAKEAAKRDAVAASPLAGADSATLDPVTDGPTPADPGTGPDTDRSGSDVDPAGPATADAAASAVEQAPAAEGSALAQVAELPTRPGLDPGRRVPRSARRSAAEPDPAAGTDNTDTVGVSGVRDRSPARGARARNVVPQGSADTRDRAVEDASVVVRDAAGPVAAHPATSQSAPAHPMAAHSATEAATTVDAATADPVLTDPSAAGNPVATEPTAPDRAAAELFVTEPAPRDLVAGGHSEDAPGPEGRRSLAAVEQGPDDDTARGADPDAVAADDPAAGHPEPDIPTVDDGPEAAEDPVSDPGAIDAVSADQAEGAGRPAPGAARWLPVVLSALFVLLAAAGGAAAWYSRGQAQSVAAERPSNNVALLDKAATSEAVEQVSKAVEAIYSYDATSLDESENRALGLINGSYASEYKQNFAAVRALPPDQRPTLTSKVVAAGVITLTERRASLLVMVDQVGRRGTNPEPINASVRLSVTAQRVDGQWKVSGVNQK